MSVVVKSPLRGWGFVALAVFSCFLAPGSSRESCIDYPSYFHWTARVCQSDGAVAVATYADISYVAGGSSLRVLQIVSPGQVQLVATLALGGPTYDLQYSGG